MEWTFQARMRGLVMKTGVDRIPMNPFVSTYAALISNYTSKDYYLNPEIAFKAQLNSIMLHGYDAGPSYGIPNGESWDFGGELYFSNRNKAAMPKVVNYPIENIKDVLKIKMPDITSAPNSSRLIRFAELSVEHGYGYGIYAGSAMSGVEALIGPHDLLTSMIRDPQKVHYLMRLSTDYILKLAKHMIYKFGVKGASAFNAYPLESHALISPSFFEEFSLPYTKEILETLQNWGVNSMLIHLCGDHVNNLKHWGSTIKIPKRAIFSIGTEMDIVKTAEYLGEDYIMGGNVRNTTLNNGTPDMVYEESREIIERMKDFPGGFILMPDCGLSPLTPACNVDAMLRATRDFGSYLI